MPSLSHEETRVKYAYSHPHDVRSRAKNSALWCTRERIQIHGCGRRSKKAGGNHDQARIWASKVRVRTQLRTRNAITRVSKSPSRSGRPFLAYLPSSASTEYALRNVREKFVHPWTLDRIIAKSWTFLLSETNIKRYLPHCCS